MTTALLTCSDRHSPRCTDDLRKRNGSTRRAFSTLCSSTVSTHTQRSVKDAQSRVWYPRSQRNRCLSLTCRKYWLLRSGRYLIIRRWTLLFRQGTQALCELKRLSRINLIVSARVSVATIRNRQPSKTETVIWESRHNAWTKHRISVWSLTTARTNSTRSTTRTTN